MAEGLQMDVEELYKKHCEEQYQKLYWKFVNETEQHTYNNL